MREMIINGEVINNETDCYFIAEIGHNHQGSVNTAKKMIKVAKECGVNAVKLQKRDNNVLFTKEILNAPYDNENSYGATYGEHRKALEFGKEEFIELISYAKHIGITLFSTAFDFNSADLLANLDIPAYKIASGDLTNTPLLKHVAEIGKPMIVSTGGGTITDVQRAYDLIMPINPQLCLLQCTAAYPIENYEDMNLKVINQYREVFPDVVVGLSDHESGIAMALVAYMMGARVIEKHFTLNRAWRGTDHAFSLSPNGLKRLVRNIQRARIAMGDGIKRKLACEVKPLYKMSKKLVLARDLKAGNRLGRNDIAIKSPGDGLAPYELENVIGKRLKIDLKYDESIRFEDLE
ncbi:N-acetylneuraminate synthase family protein [uncultured Desulfosarcina sp.]|uniref:N-acetylneuraminate synthase family protein n=1 Tax=uncultured Desulfosarcina sp. TaxID=218289 RepID=UPI0029C83763|nr:N-acetylneuraminate synthase family protein [uncultured Desulfosarcina sp.]